MGPGPSALPWALAVPTAVGWHQGPVGFTAFSAPSEGLKCPKTRVSVPQNKDFMHIEL